MITINQIQLKLSETIKLSGMSQREIGEAIGLCQQSISAYVNGHRFPSLDTLANLCKVLDIDANYILCLD